MLTERESPISNRDAIAHAMRLHYESVWQAGDAWSFETSEYERLRYEHQLRVLGTQPIAEALEIGCGSGVFTQLLARVANRVTAIDIAEAAIERAKTRVVSPGSGQIQFTVANAMEFDVEAAGPWDLIVLSETIYCLGWLYPCFDVAWFCHRLFNATRPGGRLLLANTLGRERDYLMQPWLIRTYRDLFLNIGFQLVSEDVFRGTKDEVDFEVLMSMFSRPRS
jgi:2-polyprenyl-3-methyl-5-hydroxy-6-metoxy-1,4-benzoquinol methylase